MAAYLCALYLPVDHEQEDTGTCCSHRRLGRETGAAARPCQEAPGLSWKQMATHLGQISQVVMSSRKGKNAQAQCCLPPRGRSSVSVARNLTPRVGSWDPQGL